MAIQSADSHPESNLHKHHRQHHHRQAMNDADKVDNLKSLNALLLKETAERRQQVQTLVHSNSDLQSHFNRSVMENASLHSEMNALTETAAMVEIEKRLVLVFMTEQEAIGKSKIERLMRENESEIRARTQEVNELLAKAGENEARVLTQVAELKVNCDRLMAENTANERRTESITKEKDDAQTSLVESNRLVDELQRNIAQLQEQKKAIADDKIIQDGKNSELQTSVDELKKLVDSMQIKEGALLEKIAVLEKKYAASSKNEEDMKIKINELVEENKETEKRVEQLANEKSLVAKDLENAKKELQEQKLAFGLEKTELEIQGESEIAEKDGQLSVFKGMISSLELSSANQIEKVKELEVEAGSYKSSLDQAALERDEALKQLNDQKTITADFQQTITGMEKKMEDLHEKLATLTEEKDEHLGEKKQLEDRCAGLVKQVADLESRFAESRREFDGKLNAAEAKSNRVLNILKKTVLACDDDFDQENGVEEGIKEHVAGIEAIKKAFREKESRLEEMKMQLELVKSSAKKQKGFWTMVSSATTLLAAAASLAYVARAH